MMAPILRVPTGLLVIPLVGFTLIAMGELTIGVVILEIIREFGISEIEAGGLYSAFITLTTIMTFFGGNISDKFSRKFSLVLGAGIFFSALILVSFSPMYIVLIFAYAMAGAGKGSYAPSVYSLMGELIPSSRGLLVGLTTSCFYIGGFVGPWIFGILATSFGWRIPFLLAGITGLLVTVGLFSIKEKETFVAKAFVGGSFKDVFRVRNVILITITIFASGFGFVAHIAWTPAFLHTVQTLDIASTGLSFGLFFCGGIAGSLTLSLLSDHIGRKVPIILVGFISALTSYALYSSIHLFVYLVILLSTFGFFGAPFWALQTAIAQESVRPESVGTATGVVQAIGYSAGIVAPLSVAKIIGISGISNTMIWSVSLPFLMCGVIMSGVKAGASRSGA